MHYERKYHRMRCHAYFAGLTLGLLSALQTANAAPIVFSATGVDAASIQTEVDDFRTELGALNAFEPVNVVGGRRQINWDAAPDFISDPNAFPGDFFNFSSSPRARGIEFAPGTDAMGNTGPNSANGFQLSSTAASSQPVEFGLDDQFSTFSAERLFAPTGGTFFNIDFFDPANQSQAATTRGFGAVFTDVEQLGSTEIVFLDLAGNIIETAVIETAPNGGLSFYGLVLDDPDIARVQIIAGDIPIDEFGTTPPAGVEGLDFDVVALDDFIFGEPTPVSEPMIALLFAPFALFAARLRRRKHSA